MGAFWGACTSVSIGLSELFGRRVVVGVGALSAAVAMQALGVLAAVASTLIITSTWGWVDVAWGALSGLGMGAGLVGYLVGLDRSTTTVVSPTVATLSAVIPYCYAIVRGAQAAPLAIAGALIAFVGLGLVAGGAIDPTKLRAGLRCGLASGLGYGFGMSVFIEPSDVSGAWPAVSQRVAALVVAAAAARWAGQRAVPPARYRATAIVAGVWAGLSSTFLVLGLQVDEPSTLVAASMFPVVSVIVGRWFFSDGVSRRQMAGIAVALAGITAVVAA